jgi:hypothetical protein
MLGKETMFCLYGSMEYMFWSGQWTSKYGLAMAQQNSSILPYSPTGECPLENAAATSYMAQPLHNCLFEEVNGWCRGMVWAHERAHSADVHTCHSHDCINLVPHSSTWEGLGKVMG